MLTFGASSDGEAGGHSTWHRLVAFAKTYVSNVGRVYLNFVPPLLMVTVLHMALDVQDKERFGLGWLYCTGLKDDRLREELFPPYEPQSSAQRRRTTAANAIEYAAQTA